MASTKYALDVFVNNKKFSDITFLVGRRPKVNGSYLGRAADSSPDERKEGEEVNASASEGPTLVYGVRESLKAASPLLRALVEEGMLDESDENEVVSIPDCTPRGFITMLRFLIVGREEVVDGSNVLETYYCAQKFEVVRLVSVCSDYIRRNCGAEEERRILLGGGARPRKPCCQHHTLGRIDAETIQETKFRVTPEERETNKEMIRNLRKSKWRLRDDERICALYDPVTRSCPRSIAGVCPDVHNHNVYSTEMKHCFNFLKAGRTSKCSTGVQKCKFVHNFNSQVSSGVFNVDPKFHHP